MIPIKNANPGSIKAHPAVTATRPERTPFGTMEISGFLNFSQTNISEENPIETAASVVFRTIFATSSGSDRESIDPGLNPYHPNHRIKVPRAASGIE